MNDIKLRDYFASQAMLVVLQETQETRVSSFWDWVKHILIIYLHFTFLHVKYKNVPDVYKEASKKCYEYADEMIEARKFNNYNEKFHGNI